MITTADLSDLIELLGYGFATAFPPPPSIFLPPYLRISSNEKCITY